MPTKEKNTKDGLNIEKDHLHSNPYSYSNHPDKEIPAKPQENNRVTWRCQSHAHSPGHAPFPTYKEFVIHCQQTVYCVATGNRSRKARHPVDQDEWRMLSSSRNSRQTISAVGFVYKENFETEVGNNRECQIKMKRLEVFGTSQYF
uniref:Myelin-associated glycoprotein-like n=1 Tax=Caenorhabditis tropicalis TaxID=1561998 RepID=A0A1I7UJL7_9PELO